MAFYRYRSLTNKSTIRLLDLHSPGVTFQRLRISIRHVPLLNAGPYEALSYTWGSSNATVDLFCDDGTKIPITENLNNALIALCPSKNSRTLWIDALCINQSDVHEKNLQVPLMRTIYKNATSTIVYLGHEANDSQLAMQYAEGLYEAANLKFGSEEMMTWAMLQDKVPTLADRPDDTVATALCHYFARPWFRRAWVVQEFAVAQSVSIMCGAETCHWTAPFFAWSEMKRHGIDMEGLVPGAVELAGFHAVSQLAGIRASVLREIEMPFSNLITQTGLTLSTLPHDKLYSVLGLSSDAQMVEELRPRYDLPVETIYKAYARWMISTPQGCARVLSLATTGDRQLQLPSWVPDWTVAKYRETHEVGFRTTEGTRALHPERLWFDASATFSGHNLPIRSEPHVRSGETLVVQGMVRDVVLTCSSSYRMSTLPNARPNLYRIVRDAQAMSRAMMAELSTVMTGLGLVGGLDSNAFARKVLLYRTSDNAEPPESWKKKFDDALDVLRPVYIRLQGLDVMGEPEGGVFKLGEQIGHQELNAIFDEAEQYSGSQADLEDAFRKYDEDWTFYSALQRNTMGMALARTITGRPALVPDTTRANDKICVVSGAVMPYVMRPVEGADKSFKLIGEAVIPGRMHGEYVTGGESSINRLFSGMLFDSEFVDICIT